MNIKQKLLFGFLVPCLIWGCNDQPIYEKAIADFIQTDPKGIWTDFKVLEIGEPVMITVGDSIHILKDAFEMKRKKNLDSADKIIKRHSRSLKKELLSFTRELHQRYIDKYQRMKDSLYMLKVPLPEGYSDENSKKALSQEVSCKFSIMIPLFNARQVVTKIFIFNADGSICYGFKSKKS